MRRILITGGTGFVGFHLIKALKSPSSKIFVISSGKRAVSSDPEVEYRRIDLRDRDEVSVIVREIHPDEIYHLAGITAVNDSWSAPRLTFEVNVVGTFNLLEAAMGLRSLPRILNVSTSQVYAPSAAPLTEESPIHPDNPYAASKAMAELLAVQYRSGALNRIVTARAFNHSGPGQSLNFVLPSIARQFAEIQSGKRPPTIIAGNTKVKRDFTDVRDVVRAYCMLMSDGRGGEAYNVCSGSAISLADVIEIFQSVTGTKVVVEIDPSRLRSNDVLHICGIRQKISDTTGWSPRIPLSETIKGLLDYWQSDAPHQNCNNS